MIFIQQKNINRQFKLGFVISIIQKGQKSIQYHHVMSIHQSKQQNPLSDSFYEPNDEPQDQELLLDTTQQKKAPQIISQSKDPHSILSSQPKQSSSQGKQSITKNQNNDLYVKNEHLNINADVQDYNDLEVQIQRLKKIKNQYKEQKQSIQKLSQVVQTLKSQNRSLKIKKQSNKEHSVDKNFINQFSQNHQNTQKNPGKRILNQNTIKGNLLNKNVQVKNNNPCNIGFLSPQLHRRISSNSLNNIHAPYLYNNQENIFNDMIRIDQEIMIKNHQNNKKSVIANFAQELKQQIQQNEMILQRQKKAHRDTKQKLEVCLQELGFLRALIDKQKDTDFLERENIQLKNQLEIEIQQRLLAQEKLKEKLLLLSQYESGYSTRGSQFDRELDRIDGIYFSLQKTLKL